LILVNHTTSNRWTGYYLDGKTSARHQVTVQVSASALLIMSENGPTMTWPYGSIRQTHGADRDEPVRLEYGAEPAQVLVIADSNFLTALHDAAPERTMHWYNPLRRRRHVRLTYVAAIAVLVLGGVLYLVGIPGFASVITPWVPVEWETQIGAAAVEHLAPPSARCGDPAHADILQKIVAVLIDQSPPSPYPIRVIVVRDPQINAAGVPGGFIVVFSGLLEAMETPAQFAGVLAHEMQHILKRHTTRALVQQASTGLLTAVIGGDLTGMMAYYGLEIARTLGRLQYSRQFEEEADAEGFRMLQAADIDPYDLITFYRTMKEKSLDPSGVGTYFSTHPPTDARIKKLIAMSEASPTKTTNFLSDLDWNHARSICNRSHLSTGKDG
jgi:predicted Zn-dependent protease